MNKVYHGIDLVDESRIEKLMKRHGGRFAERVFTSAERHYSQKHRQPSERLAGRFAVKEAVMKMLGAGWGGGIAWTDIETVNDPAGRPEVRLSGKTAQLARQMGIEQISVSITHTRGLAIASVVAIGK
jgi:holo-[acyl-carrier protein] synthase